MSQNDPGHPAGRAPHLRLAARAAALLAVAGTLALAPAAQALTLPPGFVESTAIAGLTDPTDLEVAPGGRVFVTEKSGIVKTYESLADPTPTVVADLRTSVHNHSSRGLLSAALDPRYPAQPYLYLYYVLDAPIGGTPPTWGTAGATSDGCFSEGDCLVSSRVSRLRVEGEQASGPEEVLLNDWCQQFQFHPGGGLEFGADGSLYVTGGDGARWGIWDYGQLGNPPNPCGDPPGNAPGTLLSPPTAEGGRLRAQDLRTGGDPLGLAGSLARIDPDTGEGVVGNPMFLSPEPNARRMLAYGFRNPVRLAIRPGTNDVWVADRGGGYFEELDRVPDPADPVRNFGWPCYEGGMDASGNPYPRIRPRSDDQDLDVCENLYAEGTATAAPYWAYDHEQPVVPGEDCATTPDTGEPSGNQISGLAFYPSGGAFPAAYEGALFFADRRRSCMYAMLAGPDGVPDRGQVTTFAEHVGEPLAIEITESGDMLYVEGATDTVKRVTYGAGAPGAAITAPGPGATWGAGEAISFSGTGTDAQGAPLPDSALDWSVALRHCSGADCHEHAIGDFPGTAAGQFTAPDHAAPGDVVVRLTATDPGGESASQTLTLAPRTVDVSLAATPAGATLTLNGEPLAAPATRTVVRDSTNSLSAPASQTIDQTVHLFSSWSDGQARTRSFTASSSRSFAATFVPSKPGEHTVTFAPEADARVEALQPGTSFGSASDLRTDGDEPGTASADETVESYLRFLVAGISGKVTSAKLRLRSISLTEDGPAASGAAGGWSEAGLTWAGRPAATTGPLADAGSIGSGAWTEWDVTGLVAGNGDVNVGLAQTSTDGISFHSREAAVPANRPQLVVTFVNDSYPRPGAATRATFSLVPAFERCEAPNRAHGPPLEHPSCHPPAQASPHLTTGGSGLPSAFAGRVRYAVLPGDPATPADDADVRVDVQITDVRDAVTLLEYLGELEVRAGARITDRASGPAEDESGTVQDVSLPITVPCVPTVDVGGSTCSVSTTLDAVVPGVIRERARSIWELGQVEVLDGGPDGDADTPGNRVFARQGVFVP